MGDLLRLRIYIPQTPFNTWQTKARPGCKYLEKPCHQDIILSAKSMMPRGSLLSLHSIPSVNEIPSTSGPRSAYAYNSMSPKGHLRKVMSVES